MWPYVNGKALVSGLNLRQMDAADMVSVLHFFFEEDNHYVSQESAESRTSLREAMYRDLYNKEYRYKTAKAKKPNEFQEFGTFSEDQADAMSVSPFNPKEKETKPYIPPTPMDANSASPFGGVLDGPMSK